MVENSQEYKLKYYPLACPFARSLTPSLMGQWMVKWLLCIFSIFDHSAFLSLKGVTILALDPSFSLQMIILASLSQAEQVRPSVHLYLRLSTSICPSVSWGWARPSVYKWKGDFHPIPYVKRSPQTMQNYLQDQSRCPFIIKIDWKNVRE